MTPITTKEVKEAIGELGSPANEMLERQVFDLIDEKYSFLPKFDWLCLGYEIARRRVEEGKEL